MKNEKNIQRVRKWQSEQKNKGLCIECCNPITSGLRCKNCNERRSNLKKKNYSKWQKEKKCTQCGNGDIVNNNLCEKHYLISTSFKRLGSGKYWRELKALLENQKFKCALTGDKISFDNMELDHILPTTRKGLSELSNVRWVTKEANRLKQNLTDKELKILCNKILITI
jgi:5-methylcytosine-specific restriction endonuclease McrA